MLAVRPHSLALPDVRREALGMIPRSRANQGRELCITGGLCIMAVELNRFAVMRHFRAFAACRERQRVTSVGAEIM
jgi:hypothetical protein